MTAEGRKRSAPEANISTEQGQLLKQRDAQPEGPSGGVSFIGSARNPECSWVLVKAQPLGEI